jgi:hypothetical protein
MLVVEDWHHVYISPQRAPLSYHTLTEMITPYISATNMTQAWWTVRCKASLPYSKGEAKNTVALIDFKIETGACTRGN